MHTGCFYFMRTMLADRKCCCGVCVHIYQVCFALSLAVPAAIQNLSLQSRTVPRRLVEIYRLKSTFWLWLWRQKLTNWSETPETTLTAKFYQNGKICRQFFKHTVILSRSWNWHDKSTTWCDKNLTRQICNCVRSSHWYCSSCQFVLDL